MSKIVFEDYFPHSAMACHDAKMMLFIEKEGMKGYGIYWTLLEHLRMQENYTAPLDRFTLKCLARQMKITPQTLWRVMNGYELFTVTEDSFSSAGLTHRMKHLDDKRERMSERGRHAAEAKWLKMKEGLDAQAVPDKSTQDKAIDSPLNPPNRGTIKSFWEEFVPPQEVADKRTYNYEGLVRVLQGLAISEPAKLQLLVERADYGRIGHPFWKIISRRGDELKQKRDPAGVILRALKKYCK